MYKALYERKTIGNSCLSTLAGAKTGTREEPVNNSKGCGGVMRAAPAGLFFMRIQGRPWSMGWISQN